MLIRETQSINDGRAGGGAIRLWNPLNVWGSKSGGRKQVWGVKFKPKRWKQLRNISVTYLCSNPPQRPRTYSLRTKRWTTK